MGPWQLILGVAQVAHVQWMVFLNCNCHSSSSHATTTFVVADRSPNESARRVATEIRINVAFAKSSPYGFPSGTVSLHMVCCIVLVVLSWWQ